jgi:Na+/melibiose symporter-like transporter
VDITTNNAAKLEPSVPIGTRIAYGLGSVAFGVKGNGFDYFLMLFYSQVVGLDARLVGIALTAALVFDALSDPVVGYWSDNLRSRWGRRHPFMYVAALPVAVSYFMLWNPPQLSQSGLFWFLLVTAVCIRTFITLYETPSTALAPELSRKYDERSSLLAMRSYFGWTAGVAMAVMMFFFVFPAMTTPEFADGRFNRDSYYFLGAVGSVLILLSIMISALGTHSRIPTLVSAPPRAAMTLKAVFGEIVETLSNRSFIALFVSAIFGAVATGLATSLSFYFYTFFWEFSSEETGVLIMGVFISALIAFGLAPVVTRRLGKKRGAMIVGIVAFVGAPLPILLRLLGWLPDNDSPAIFWIVLGANIVDLGLIICFQILTNSMMADLVEQSELETGRRSEGVFFSAATFIRKAVQGLGILAASLVLTMAAFPSGVGVEQVPQEAVWRLGAYYVPAVLSLWITMMLVLSCYRLDRADHEENLRQLAERRAAAAKQS